MNEKRCMCETEYDCVLPLAFVATGLILLAVGIIWWLFEEYDYIPIPLKLLVVGLALVIVGLAQLWLAQRRENRRHFDATKMKGTSKSERGVQCFHTIQQRISYAILGWCVLLWLWLPVFAWMLPIIPLPENLQGLLFGFYGAGTSWLSYWYFVVRPRRES